MPDKPQRILAVSGRDSAAKAKTCCTGISFARFPRLRGYRFAMFHRVPFAGGSITAGVRQGSGGCSAAPAVFSLPAAAGRRFVEPPARSSVGCRKMNLKAKRIDHCSACFTVDVEQDCPPYLASCRGMTEGLPVLLDLLREVVVRGTFFVTGEMARRFPVLVSQILAEGHELGCHGDTHLDFTWATPMETDHELGSALATLRGFGPVKSFRAPYLRFPSRYVPLLANHGVSIDSSQARYKLRLAHHPASPSEKLIRVPVSVTSSILRMPRWFVARWLLMLQRPLILFVHPWEAVDFRSSSLRWDCRAGTGASALRRWREVISSLKEHGLSFRPIAELETTTVVA